MKKLLLAVLIAFSFSFTTNGQEPVLPFAGEGYWNTRLLTTPSYEEFHDTLNKKPLQIRSWYKDTSFSVSMPCQWVVAGHIWQFLPEGIRKWQIESSAITGCGQVAEYKAKLVYESAYSTAHNAWQKNKPKTTSSTPVKKLPANEREATILVLCPQGQFSSILLIEQNGIATYHNN